MMLLVEDNINRKFDYTTLDSLESCIDVEHFKNYKKTVSYNFNSRGFRDDEWPQDMSNVIWCIGDSFTLGLGQPFEETWPRLLQKSINKRCINIGEDGCSNDTIALRIQEISKFYKPKLIIVMWSFFARRRIGDINVQYSKSKEEFGLQADLKNFLKNLEATSGCADNIIHTTIPGPGLEQEEPFFDLILKKRNLANMFVKYKQLDFSRDGFHFDIMTSESLVKNLLTKINEIDKLL